MADSLALVVRFTVRDGAADAFDELLGVTVREVNANEPRTLIYTNHRVDGAPAERVLYERYRSRQAFDEHERQPYVRHFLAERDQYLTATSVDFLTPVDVADDLGEQPAA